MCTPSHISSNCQYRISCNAINPAKAGGHTFLTPNHLAFSNISYHISFMPYQFVYLIESVLYPILVVIAYTECHAMISTCSINIKADKDIIIPCYHSISVVNVTYYLSFLHGIYKSDFFFINDITNDGTSLFPAIGEIVTSTVPVSYEPCLFPNVENLWWDMNLMYSTLLIKIIEWRKEIPCLQGKLCYCFIWSKM